MTTWFTQALAIKILLDGWAAGGWIKNKDCAGILEGEPSLLGISRRATVSYATGIQERCLSLERKHTANTLDICFFFSFLPTLSMWLPNPCQFRSLHTAAQKRNRTKTLGNSSRWSSPGFSSCSSRWAALTGLGCLQLFWTFATRKRCSEVMSVLGGSTVSGLGY